TKFLTVSVRQAAVQVLKNASTCRTSSMTRTALYDLYDSF
ncbi:hypothetical protein ALQ14_103308, partial [Pseudomonas savastanoi pv. glycinea]